MIESIKKKEKSDLTKPMTDNELMNIWDDKGAIWAHFGEPMGLSKAEFFIFVNMGKFCKANPYLREIWAVKYDKSKPAAIFLARDHYRKIALRQYDYDGHTAQAVFEEDEFEFDIGKGIPEHTYTQNNRGKLIAAYCLVWKKGIKRPYYVYVSLEEADKGQSTWKSQPVTQLEKVAEARGLRQAWQEKFSGTYSEDEAPIIEASHKEETSKKILANTPPVPVKKTEKDFDIPEIKEEKTETNKPQNEPKPASGISVSGKYKNLLWERLGEITEHPMGRNDMLELLTEYTDKNTGEFHKGMRNIAYISEKMAQVALGNLNVMKAKAEAGTFNETEIKQRELFGKIGKK